MNIYKRQRFPPDIISYAVWLYHRFNLSHRDIEDWLAERRISVSHESMWLWCIKCGPVFARRLRRKHRGFGDRFYVDEGFVKIRGKQHYLWRAVDQDGDGVDVFLQDRRDGRAAKRFCRRLIRRHAGAPGKIVTDQLGSDRVAHRAWAPDSYHVTDRYANNRAEQSHEAPRFREREIRRFKSTVQAHRFLGVHSAVYNRFNWGRHMVRARDYRDLRHRAFVSWIQVTAG